ncbi:hypothetical protein [Streptomyces sp. NPDC093225]|uniref:hypothetical protein n=1 Tax=Streptomyces sp. NPDC093225 TaxID=3366034 RepID=UPI003801B4EE
MTDAARFSHFHRLEPQVRSSGSGGQLDEALEARVADPLFLLARQWQLAEFRGEDGGSPVLVTIGTAGAEVDRFRPGTGSPSAPYPPGTPVEYLAEAGGPRELTLRAAARAGARFLSLLGPLSPGVRDDVTRKVLKRCPLARPADGGAGPEHPIDPAGLALWRVLRHRTPDGDRLARELAAGWRPADLAGAAAALFDEAADRWQRWFDAEHPVPSPSTWMTERLEHRFGVEAEVGDRRVVLTAPEYPGGSADPYRFDLDAGGTPLDLPDAPGPRHVSLPTRAAYPGMPADRWWEFEDATVNMPAIEAGPADLARLLVMEFANVYGNDHWIVPVDLEVGKLHWVTGLSVLDTFGGRLDIAPVAHRQLSLFRLSDARDEAGAPGAPLLPLLPTAHARTEGGAVEEVLFVRDEMANLGWGIERVVQSATGRPRARADEFPLDEGPDPVPGPGAVLAYRLLTPVPPYWVPLVPVPLVPGPAGGADGDGAARGAVRFRRGVVRRTADGVQPGAVGRLLEPEVKPVYFRDEEIPRAGVTVSRVPVVVRDGQGRLYHWVGRRVRAGRGEAASGLAFDAALPAQGGTP